MPTDHDQFHRFKPGDLIKARPIGNGDTTFLVIASLSGTELGLASRLHRDNDSVVYVMYENPPKLGLFYADQFFKKP